MGKIKSIFISSLRELIIFEVEKQNLDEVNKDSCLWFLFFIQELYAKWSMGLWRNFDKFHFIFDR